MTRPRRRFRAPAILHVEAGLLMIGLRLTVDPEFAGGHAIRLSNCEADQRRGRRRAERPLIERLTLRAMLARRRRLR